MSDATPAPKKSKKTLLFAIIGAVVVLGGGAGAYFGFMKKGGEEHAEEAKHEPEVKHPAQFVELDPPFVVNFEPGSGARFLQIAVQLMTREPLMVEFLKHNTPIIRNDLLLLFGNKKVDEVSSQDGKEALRAAALEAVRKIIEAEGEKPDALEAV
jgi:flagellar FliL protein